ncbi:unnamed protein product [Durusdinium trenchii]|uniref:Uncharacterized protein n=2 Tax=Durusdinium trenchii TaxID=1381693 RepID=A0ABP0QL29_9DINO
MDLLRPKAADRSPDSGHGDESVSTGVSSHSLPNHMTESLSTRASRQSRSSTKTICSMSRLDQRKALVRSFLQANDFLHVNEGKRYWGHTCYPLHVAVHQKNAAVIKALLLLGARSDLKYRGYTPEEYAQRKHRRWGGYDDVLKVLDETARPKRFLTQRGCVSDVGSDESTEISVEV